MFLKKIKNSVVDAPCGTIASCVSSSTLIKRINNKNVQPVVLKWIKICTSISFVSFGKQTLGVISKIGDQ